jgi:hypothetical protein
MYGSLPKIQTETGEIEGIKIVVPNPPKTAIVRLPNNSELLARLDAQRALRRSIGRRQSQTEHIANPKLDLALFKAIRLDKDGSEFDEFEAMDAISKLTHYDITQYGRSGNDHRIVMTTPFGEVVHYLGSPLQRDLYSYRRGIMVPTSLPHGVEDLRFKHQVACDLYDSAVSKIEGYAESIGPKDVPPHHKSAVASELAAAMDSLDPALDPLA